MSTYEKIASVLLVLLFAVILVLWFGKPHPEGAGPRGSDFDESTGQDFKLGPFTQVTYTRVSGTTEAGCSMLQPVIIAALHDINERLAAQSAALGVAGSWEAFEVNAATLNVLCNTQATIQMGDGRGDQLVLTKPPFGRAVPQGGTQADVGTEVSLEATVTRVGTSTPAEPQATARILIPDRFLDAAGQ